MSDRLKKISALILGTIFLFFLAEVFLRVTRYILLPPAINTKADIDDQSFRILFLGNSHTIGAGVKQTNSYPGVLQKFFNQQIKTSQKVVIFNGGIPSANTRVIYNSLDSMITATRPHVAVLMLGEANIWNREGYSEYQKSKGDLSNSQTLLNWSFNVLNHSSVFRWFSSFTQLTKSMQITDTQFSDYNAYRYLGQLSGWGIANFKLESKEIEIEKTLNDFIQRQRQKITPEALQFALITTARFEAYRMNNLAKALDLIKECLLVKPSDFHLDSYIFLEEIATSHHPKNYVEEAQRLLMTIPKLPVYGPSLTDLKIVFQKSELNHHTPDELFKILLFGIQSSPGHQKAANFLATQYMARNNPELALATVIKSIEINPFSFESNNISFVLDMVKDKSNPLLSQKAQNYIDSFYQRFPQEVGRYNDLSPTDLQKWITDDTQKIIQKLKENHIKVLVQNYHWIRDRKEASYLYAAAQAAAENEKVPFLDTHSGFLKTIGDKNQNLFFNINFGPNDSHPSELGHLIIARLIYESLQKNQLLPEPISNFDSTEIEKITID